jgi:hypothetical protein
MCVQNGPSASRKKSYVAAKQSLALASGQTMDVEQDTMSKNGHRLVSHGMPRSNHSRVRKTSALNPTHKIGGYDNG